MKRFLMLITAMTLFLTAACTATADGVTFKTAYFTMQMPEGWEIDTDDLEKKEGEETLGFFGVELPEGMLIGGAYLVYYEQLKDIALWNSSEEELKEKYDNFARLQHASTKSVVDVTRQIAGKILDHADAPEYALPEYFSVGMPISSPVTENMPPPLLPLLMAASTWIMVLVMVSRRPYLS